MTVQSTTEHKIRASSITLGDLRALVDSAKDAPDSASVGVSSYSGDMREPGTGYKEIRISY